ENDDNNLVLNLESRVEKQDSLLTNMFNMIIKLTGQLSDKEQQHDPTTKEFASIGVLAIQPTSLNTIFNFNDCTTQ
ncbi:hypothetical protein RhiirA1_472234, partial [Rhizophagus irregularis]